MELNKIKEILNTGLSEENLILVLPEIIINLEIDPFLIYTLRSVILDIISLYEETEKLEPTQLQNSSKVCHISSFIVKQKVNAYLKDTIIKIIDMIIIDAPLEIKYKEATLLINNLIDLEFKEF
ncbi:MAG: hypothetical protein EVG15_01770 [Candidatus Acididesulfobacter diazotrophicus]|jgi:hypothetical protein|uniref:Uncharacterized protein n=1 Tax=Candidatus Acididesulfobacter diazotrophicus TaxID=2597226 RepID=A0A519BPQ3_9DELT|nr:MAG: hypothetical protein EVG15_01770 [Candidatus Acididesulfobacter diazotrophicus]